VVQSPESAKFDAMPRAAIALCPPDLVLTPAEMGPRLAELTGFERPPEGSPAPEPAVLASVARVLLRTQGVDFSGYKDSTLQRQVSRRIAIRQVEGLPSYLPLLAADDEEQRALVASLLVTVTSFFRDAEAFDALRIVLADYLTQRGDDDVLRIWVPGCATGEEVYSLLILVDELLGRPGHLASHVRIFGTDLDESALAVARRALYPASALATLPAALVAEHFQELGDGYRVDDRLRECTVFARHNVVRDPPFPRLDLVSFRNTLIYLTNELQDRALNSVRFGLRPGGLLFLGKAETAPVGPSDLAVVDATNKIYAVRSTDAFRTMTDPAARWEHRVPAPAPIRAAAVPDAVPVEHVQVLQAIARATAGPGVVLDLNHDVVLFLGDVAPFCRIAEGRPSSSITDLLLPELVTEARALLLTTRSDSGPAEGHPTSIPGSDRTVRMRARALSGTGQPLLLLSFEDVDPVDAAGGDRIPRTTGFEAELERLESDLLRSQDTLLQSRAELEAANEELQAMTEELQGSAEELQASNEELQASNEELSATNEELVGVNSQLRERGSELQQTLDDLANIEATIPQGVVIVDENLSVTRFNRPAVRVFALVDTDIGTPLLSIPTTMPVPGLEAALRAALAGVPSGDLEFVREGAAYLARALPYQALRGERGGVILTLTDITDRVASERRASELLGMFESVFRTPAFGAAILAQDQTVLMANTMLGHILGIDATTLTGRPVTDFLPLTPGGSREPMGAVEQLERVEVPDGATRWVRTDLRDLPDPVGRAHAVLIVEDATDLHERSRLLAERAFYDALTGLANRTATHEMLEKSLAAARRTGSRLAVAWLDLDNFKEINDRGGHAAGDTTLRTVASRIRAAVRDRDEVGRVGGDEFTIIFGDLTNLAEVDSVVERLLDAVRQPLPDGGAGVPLTASVGVSVFPDDGETGDALLRAADAAMYAAKSLGGDAYTYFQQSMSDAAESRRAMRATITQALAEGRFELHYQPIVNGSDGSVWGAEALLRMDVDGSLLPASEFVPFCEESGQIRALGPVTMSLLRDDAAALRAAGHGGLRLCLNLSVAQLEDQEFASLVDERRLSGLDDLVVEVTETVFLPDSTRAMSELTILRRLGAELAVDDFGTGFSNLRLLLDVAPDVIKLDRSFLQVGDITDPRAFITAAVEMAHAVGAIVVAEGVETPEVRELALGLGVDLLQGWHVALPMPRTELVAWLRPD
jgi:diguanylate cyclase (GGDEF)-like protein